MKWLRFRIKTTVDAEDIVISTLYDIGLEGAQIEDNVPLTALEKEQMFVDIPPVEKEDDGTAYLSFFVEELDKKDKILSDIKRELDELREFNIDIGEGTVTVTETEDIDWINNWKKYFHQFSVDDVLVIPSWEKINEDDKSKYVLHIDPGTAFGTGAHETTQLCIRELRKYVNPETVLLDVGTGSGILAILSVMFGAKEAVGTDLDPCAVDAVHDNMEANNIPKDKFRMMIGNIITDSKIRDDVGYEKYDIVVANILADVLVPLTPVVKDHIKKGGIFITSGIIEGKEEVVKEAMEKAGFRVLCVNSQGEWRSVTAVRE
ncbi:MAG: 50S ribosomal protein L11 methyltransferase [Lachnospiraceae bacterium]|nr:50S ribosomal protein L11 methyltransferase [Lachnospiraceae bacterium]